MEKIDLTPETRRVATLEKGSLQRRLGVREVFGVAFGDVGSSIIYALGVVAFFALGATPLALAIAGVFFICTALTYAELGATIPEAGGAQVFARRAFNDLVSFLAGWALLLDYVLTASISAYTIGPYLSQFLPALSIKLVHIGMASGVMIVLAALNIYGIKESSRVSLILSILCIATLGFMSLYGLVTVFDPARFISQMKIGTAPTWGSFLHAVVLASVAYIGIETATQVSGEARDPGRTLPRALKWTVAAVLTLYAGICMVGMTAMPPAELGSTWKEQPLVGIAHHLPGIGGPLAAWVGVMAALVLFIATNAGLIGASRLAYSMSSVLQLPGAFSRLHSTRKTPWISLVFFTVCAIAVLCVTHDMDSLTQLYSFGSVLAFAMAHLSLIGLRIKEPGLARPFKVPFNLRIRGRDIPLTAVIGLLATTGTWVAILFLFPRGRDLGFVWMGIGIVLYLAVRQRQDIPMVDSVRIERVSIPEYRTWEVKHILVPTLGGPNTETVQVACRIARETGAEVTALFVIEIPEALPLETFLSDRLNAGDTALTRAQAIGREVGVIVQAKLMQARRASVTILEVARERNCDLIVLGALAGKPSPTAQEVLQKAACRIWICTSTQKA